MISHSIFPGSEYDLPIIRSGWQDFSRAALPDSVAGFAVRSICRRIKDAQC